MNRNHWICIAVTAIIFYYVGVQWPTWGKTALSKVGVS